MNTRTRIKFCGITRAEDARAAVAAGADALGMVFFAKSKRALTPQRAAEIRKIVPAFVDVVALFVNPDPVYVQEIIDAVAPDILQFHGNESADDCERYGMRYMKAFHMGAPGMDTSEDVLQACRRHPAACAWLFDTYSSGYGGSGRGFDHALLERVRTTDDSLPLVLAGGLAPDNVAQHVQALSPYAVDVSSGIEIEPGIKSAAKMAAFSKAVQMADSRSI